MKWQELVSMVDTGLGKLRIFGIVWVWDLELKVSEEVEKGEDLVCLSIILNPFGKYQCSPWMMYTVEHGCEMNMCI